MSTSGRRDGATGLFTVAIVLFWAVAATALQGTDNADAKLHYKVALIALEKNDLETALTELRRAAELAPSNPLVFYNLAVVYSKKAGMEATALEYLQKARRLGLPASQGEAALELEARLTYEVSSRTRRDAEKARLQADLPARFAELERVIASTGGSDCSQPRVQFEVRRDEFFFYLCHHRCFDGKMTAALTDIDFAGTEVSPGGGGVTFGCKNGKNCFTWITGTVGPGTRYCPRPTHASAAQIDRIYHLQVPPGQEDRVAALLAGR